MMIPPFAVPTGRSMFGDCWYQRIPTTKSKIWNLRLRFQFPPKTSLPYGSKSRLLRRYKLDTPRSVATRYVDSKRIRADPGGSIRADPRYRRSSPPICREKKTRNPNTPPWHSQHVHWRHEAMLHQSQGTMSDVMPRDLKRNRFGVGFARR